MNRIVFVTEADDKVASGHLMETVVCAQIFSEEGCDVRVWINSDVRQELKDRIPIPVWEYEGDINENVGSFLASSDDDGADWIVFNLREVRNRLLLEYRRRHRETKIICIDEWGHRRLDCDMIINPMVDSYYWEYLESEAQKYYGAEYLVLFPELKKYREMKKRIKPRVEKVVITMGGVDPCGHTQAVLKALAGEMQNIAFDVVLGGGFRDVEAMYNLCGRYKNVNVYHNISFLYQLVYDADLLFCAGGNTLYEAAAIGTPAVIIPSAPHEERNAKEFVRRGFGILHDRKKMPDEDIVLRVNDVAKCKIRKEMSVCGKKIVDGYGDRRIYELISGLK